MIRLGIRHVHTPPPFRYNISFLPICPSRLSIIKTWPMSCRYSSTRRSRPNAYKKHLPIVVSVLASLWLVFGIRAFMSNPTTSSDRSNQELITTEGFTPYTITFKHFITPDLFLIELTPTLRSWKTKYVNKRSYWDGSQLWSVEIKQPDIMITRNYTPLPLYVLQTYKNQIKEQDIIKSENENENDKKQYVIKMLGDSKDEGKMMFLIKKYKDGEVSTWLSKRKVGDRIEIRGPHIEFKFPQNQYSNLPPRPTMIDTPSSLRSDIKYTSLPKHDDILFLAAGTGITPILQMLLSKNPFRGKVDVIYSVKNKKDIAFPNFLMFLEKTGRARFWYFIESKGQFITSNDLPNPTPSYLGLPPLNDNSQKTIQDLLKINAKRREIRKIQNHDPIIGDYKTAIDHTLAEEVNNKITKPSDSTPSWAIVCGPEGYISYVAGQKEEYSQGNTGGLLKDKGWDESNVYKM